MAAALIDRLLHHCHIVNIRGSGLEKGECQVHFVVFATHRDETGQARERAATAFAGYVGDRDRHPDVTVHHGGPTLGSDGETVNGLLLVVEAPSLSAARAFVDNSPYGNADLLAESHVRPWRWLTGRPG